MLRAFYLLWFAGWAAAGLVAAGEPKTLEQPANTWVKRSPLQDGPVSPAMGYETSLGYDPLHRRVIRWGGHNQGGGGEQNAETWVFDPATAKWELKEPNRSPPGVCCAQQNVFDPVQNRFIRFPAFSGSHGWQWFREIYLNNTTVWNYELGTNTWRDRRPAPAPRVSPLRCAAWDSDGQVVVLFGGEGNQEGTVVYDPYTNTWTRMNPKSQPAFRSGGNLAYDAARRRHILFGAQFSDDPHTWAYDLRKNEWLDLKPKVQPPTNRNDAVLAYDPNGQVVIALVRVADKLGDDNEVLDGHLETWAYDGAANEWRKMNPPQEPGGRGSRRRVLVAVPNHNVILLENYVNPSEKVPGVEREQQIWTYRYADAKPASGLQPPAGVTVVTSANAATLQWQPSPGAAGYVVYRGEGARPWLAEWKPVGKVGQEQTRFQDAGLKRGTVYYYAVRAVGAAGQESGDSLKVRTQPRIVEDAVVSVLSPREVRLTWSPLPGPDIVGYHIERAVVEVFSEDEIARLKKDTPPLPEPSVGAIRAIGPFQRLTTSLVQGTSFTDSAIDLSKPQTVPEPIWNHRFAASQLDAGGKPYRFAVFGYRITPVNALGVEGGASPYFLTIPSAPQWLFSKEDGDQCQLKWAANPEQNIKGYRVYRINGPRINGPGQKVVRLTDQPIEQTTFIDPQAGKDAQRYHVVAVDALGQEGIPSSPTWHYREWRRFYLPFIGEWHQ
jgi:hypothetical protein